MAWQRNISVRSMDDSLLRLRTQRECISDVIFIYCMYIGLFHLILSMVSPVFCAHLWDCLAPRPAPCSLATNVGCMGSTSQDWVPGHSGNGMYRYWLSTVSTIYGKREQRVRCNRFSCSLCCGKSRCTRVGFHRAKIGLPGRKSRYFEPVFLRMGSLGCLEAGTAKKAWFFNIYFGGFRLLYIFKKSPIGPLSSYIFLYIYLSNG